MRFRRAREPRVGDTVIYGGVMRQAAREHMAARAAKLYEDGIEAGVRMTLDALEERFPRDDTDLYVNRDGLLEFVAETRRRLEAGR